MTIIIDPQTGGVAGNMLIGALVDLGSNEEKIMNIMESVAKEFGEVKVTFDKVNKMGIESTYCNVEMLEKKDPICFKDFIAKINKLPIEEKIIKKSINVFTRIAIAEGKVHGKTLEEVHFHEVGTSDAVADVIGAIYAYYSLKLDESKVIGLPIALGGGQVKSAHGMIPVPGPATLEILKNAKCFGGPVSSELATPTGAAIYMEICDEIKEFIPLISPEKIGYGAGTKDFDFPNILRIIKTKEIIKEDTVDILETNIDHLTGEELGYLFDKLLKEGASDVSITPIIMKKNRPGSLLKVISKKENRDHLLNVMFKEIGTLGIRITSNLHRGIAKREFVKRKIEIDGKNYDVTFKIGYLNGKIISKRAEYEDVKKIAEKTNIPLKELNNIISDYND